MGRLEIVPNPMYNIQREMGISYLHFNNYPYLVSITGPFIPYKVYQISYHEVKWFSILGHNLGSVLSGILLAGPSVVRQF